MQAVRVRPGEETMDASASRVPPLETEPEEVLGLSQLPPELLLAVLSLLPPRTLLGRCRQVCRRWRALVDAPGLWLKILARDHRALWPVVRSCLPRADAASACLLGRFCARGPIGRNLLCKREREGSLWKSMVVQDLDDLDMEESWEVMPRAPLRICFRSPYRWYHKKKQVLDLEEEGFWPELLDSGKIEICFSDWWTDQQDINSIYRLTIQLLDANQAILDQFSTTLFPIRNRRHTSFLEVSHVFSNLKTGVRFVSLEHWVREMEFCSKHYGIYLPNSSVIVQVVLS
ncbi:F-box only protein 27 [Camelus ferus]|uniref:F-box only protein 27 n=2 Tax=Camelus TaxID=9836 RepID=A0A8B8TP79_CAMFR|nr:F-box only protein 27 [Camelus ferus]